MSQFVSITRRQGLVLAAGAVCGAGTAQAARGDHSLIHAFDMADGTQPLTGLLDGRHDRLWGTTSVNGPEGQGTVVCVEPDGVLRVVHAFGGPTGANPGGGLVAGPRRWLYGTTQRGSINDQGVVYAITHDESLRVLHRFGRIAGDGRAPQKRLTVGPDGRLYGITQAGGHHRRGTVFALAVHGAYERLRDFNGDDGTPCTSLVVGTDGSLYGAASWTGFPFVHGVIYRISPAGEYSVLYRLRSDSSEGVQPLGLTPGSDGWLYGSTLRGGRDGQGVLFRVSLGGVYEQLDTFWFHGVKGRSPAGGLIELSPGHFYGATRLGGLYQAGTVYHFNMHTRYRRVLHHLNPAAGEGRYPVGELARGGARTLVGATEFGGGTSDAGTLYRIALA